MISPFGNPELERAPPTPVRVDRLAAWLEGYDGSKKKFLLDGFSEGFHVGFDGKTNNSIPENLSSAKDRPEFVSQHIQKELEAGRLAGPFKSPPFEEFQCSPIGLVEKKEPGKFRMIHHLSYPGGSSVNDQIEPEWASVQYATISDAIDLVVNLCPHAFMAKTDVKHAFRIIPLHPNVRHLFIFQWEGMFYVDLKWGVRLLVKSLKLSAQQWTGLLKKSWGLAWSTFLMISF